MKFFNSPKDLEKWVLSNKKPAEAINKIIEVIGENNLSVKDGCELIFQLSKNKIEENEEDLNNEIGDASKALFVTLASYNITEIKKEGENMNKINKWNSAERLGLKQAQVTRPPASPYCTRVDDNKYTGTPWRKDRDAIYDFTHRNPDMLSFDDDPNRVYSGEALWRRFIMDKYYREYANAEGRLVGGYINDRFQVFHDVGGNQMALANGERTRKPRPHQYSIERRLEEARGSKTEDILPLRASTGAVRVIIAGSAECPANSSDIKHISNEDEVVTITPKDAYTEEDTIVKAFVDILEMKEAGINDEDVIIKVAGHYQMPIAKVAKIKNFANKMKSEHKYVVYASDAKKKIVSNIISTPHPRTWINQDNNQIPLPAGTQMEDMGNGKFKVMNTGEIVVPQNEVGSNNPTNPTNPNEPKQEEIDASMKELEGIEDTQETNMPEENVEPKI